MLEIKNLTKTFGDKAALADVNINVPEACIFGLVGSNGAGKSTLMRSVCGVYRPTSGQCLVDGEEVFDNPDAKRKIFFVSDTPYFFRPHTIDSMADFYASMYPNWSKKLFEKLLSTFQLPRNRKLTAYSKGMGRQAFLILGLSTQPEYLMLDEAFDGLDPVMRAVVRKIVVQFAEERGNAVIISSHNLKEIEDMCSHVAMLHEGRCLLNADRSIVTHGVHGVDFVFQKNEVPDFDTLGLKIMRQRKKGLLHSYVFDNPITDIESAVEKIQPLLHEITPLSFEELFMETLRKKGYSADDIWSR